MEAAGLKMTHEELLAKMDDLDIALSNGFGKAETIIGSIKAVRAVIELHKPDSDDKETCQAHEMCWGCGEYGMTRNCECNAYPCSTIQAIMKELQ